MTISSYPPIPSGAGVATVSATTPVVSTGGTTPDISIPAATTSVNGYLTSTDWNTFNNKGSGDVVGPASATDNAVARFDATTGKLLQNSVVTVGDTGATTGITTLSASTSVTTPIVQATNSAGLALKNSGGTTQISMGAGGGDNVTVAVSTNLNGTNAQIDISPTGTGHVHIKPTGVNSVEIAPTFVGEMDNVTIGAITPAAGTFTTASLTGTTNQINAVAVTSDPAAPSAGNLKVFARTQAGYTSLAFENATNAIAPFQTMMPFRKVSMWNPPGSQSATNPGLFGFGALTALGTNTVVTPANTNMVTRTRRANFVSSATAGNFAGHHEAAGNIYLGSATSPAYSGFYFSVRFFIADTVANPRTFVGLSSITGTPTNIQPSTLTNCIGVGQGASDTNLFIYYGGSASQTPIDLGVNFPANTASTDLYELTLFSPPTSDNTVYYQVRRLNTGDVATGTLTGTAGTVLPLNTTVIGYRAWRTNNATASAVSLSIVGVYCETDF